MSNPAGLVVVGSLNMDFVVQVDHLPAPGETVLGRQFQMIPGGKGANQACAAGRLARTTPVTMIGRVGLDTFGDHLKASLAAAGVDVSGVMGTRDTPTGVALIWVEKSGQNSIVVASGANAMVTPADIESSARRWQAGGCVLFQLETPLDAVETALRSAIAAGARTILDPAPARPEALRLLPWAAIVTPNETEASILLGRQPGRVTLDDAPGLARALRQAGAQDVVLKLGEQGCYYLGGEGEFRVPGFPVAAVDTTAAGDTFNAALAVALCEGRAMLDALRFANAAAAISVTRLGAQSSAPAREETEAFLVRG
jgi:ribokinase